MDDVDNAKGALAAVGLIAEIAGLSASWPIYQTGLGAGPKGVVSMLFGMAVAGFGLLAGLALGMLSVVNGDEMPALALKAIILPLGIVASLIVGRTFPL